tara:strand:+ start:688 stop:1854 length:1167 start_codon:yes stop_codon:yes gene_type:complete
MFIDFDEPINRINSNSIKWDAMEKLYGVSPKDGLAMWVADMDFKAPEAVNSCIRNISEHGIHGYFGDYSGYKTALRSWMSKKHNWEIEDSWSAETHGLGAAIGISLRAYSEPGDEVIIFSPVYHSFARIIKANNRKVKENNLQIENGIYKFDLDNLGKSLSGNEKIMLFCSPHNPGGRIWKKNELEDLVNFCEEHNLVLLCDEIHADLTYPNFKHNTLLAAVPSAKNRAVVMVSTTKPFNLSGGEMGSVIIPDPDLRYKFDLAHEATGKMPNRIGMKMAEAAYLYGEEWLFQLVNYLEKNKFCFEQGVKSIKGFESMPLQSTYLAWINFEKTGLSPTEFYRLLFKEAKIAANIGSSFGSGGEMYVRINFACRKAVVEDAIERLQNTFS